MIFTIGFCVWLLGGLLMRFFGTGWPHIHNTADKIGATLYWVGAALVVVSLCKLAIRYMP